MYYICHNKKICYIESKQVFNQINQKLPITIVWSKDFWDILVRRIYTYRILNPSIDSLYLICRKRRVPSFLLFCSFFMSSPLFSSLFYQFFESFAPLFCFVLSFLLSYLLFYSLLYQSLKSCGSTSYSFFLFLFHSSLFCQFLE